MAQAASPWEMPRKKLIESGWDSPSSAAEFKRLLPDMEATPYDGVVINLEITDESGKPRLDEAGKPIAFSNVLSKTPWRREWFLEEIKVLQSARSTKLTDNFIRICAGPSTVDWFDDEGWKHAVEHFRIAAWISREGGFKGVLLDPENYVRALADGRRAPFNYNRQEQQAKYTFTEYSAKVRQRGREVMEAMAAEYPGMTFFTYFMQGGLAMGPMGGDPWEGMEEKRYNLYPAFINGWLDAVPPGITIVDGNEHAYPHSSELQYLKRANATRNAAISLVAPENRAKYRAQVQVSIAIYLDAFVSFPTSDPHTDVITDPPLEHLTVADRLREAVGFAREASDEYVWTWSEQYRWWPTKFWRVKPQTWEDILPGTSAALRDGMDPEKAALARAAHEFVIQERKAGTRGVRIPNLLKNGDFNNGASSTTRPAAFYKRDLLTIAKAPAEEWTPVQAGTSRGELNRDVNGASGHGSARLEGCSEAAFVQEAAVSPRRFYRFRVRARQMGEGAASVRLRWADANGEVLGETLTLAPTAPPKGAWGVISGVLKAPDRAARLGVELRAEGQASSNDVIWYDDAELYVISVN